MPSSRWLLLLPEQRSWQVTLGHFLEVVKASIFIEVACACLHLLPDEDRAEIVYVGSGRAGYEQIVRGIEPGPGVVRGEQVLGIEPCG